MDNASTRRHAKRATQRMMSDLYGRGVTRMAVEAVNLLIMRKQHDVTRAESMKSNLLVPFACAQFIACHQAAEGQSVDEVMNQPLEIDRRNPRRKRVVTDKNVGYKYGYRGTHDAVRYLTPYEFTSEWDIQRATYPCQSGARFSEAHANADAQLNESPYHAYLTETGKAKVKGNSQDLLPGIDYRIHGDEGQTKGRTWVAFPESASTLRHEWVMVRRIRPAVPKFQGAPLLKAGSYLKLGVGSGLGVAVST